MDRALLLEVIHESKLRLAGTAETGPEPHAVEPRFMVKMPVGNGGSVGSQIGGAHNSADSTLGIGTAGPILIEGREVT